MHRDKRFAIQLCALVLLHLLLFWNSATDALFSRDVGKAARNWEKGLATALAGGITLLLVYITGETAKARIVFWSWSHPFPSSRAFSEYRRRHSGIDAAKLKTKVGHFPRDPSKQDALWRKLYRTVESRSELVHIQRAYWIYRDWACITAALFLGLVPVSIFVFPSRTWMLSFALALVAEYLVARTAAVNCGKRFVLTVLELKASEAGGTP
jgi:hypothetical protein